MTRAILLGGGDGDQADELTIGPDGCVRLAPNPEDPEVLLEGGRFDWLDPGLCPWTPSRTLAKIAGTALWDSAARLDRESGQTRDRQRTQTVLGALEDAGDVDPWQPTQGLGDQGSRRLGGLLRPKRPE